MATFSDPLNIISMTSTQGLLIVSNLEGSSRLGYAVAAAGDFNKDGIADVLIGAPYSNKGFGAAYVIYGGSGISSPINVASMSSTQYLVINGLCCDDYYKGGWSVAAAGDFNNDGIADVLLGSNGLYAAVIYGSARPPASINVATMGSTQGLIINGCGGYVVTAVGDFNNDGIADVLVGMMNGRVCIIYGSANSPASIDVTTMTNAQGLIIDRCYGQAAAAAGDFNNDGIADVLIGAPTRSNWVGISSGVAYIIYGSVNLPLLINVDTMTNKQGITISGKNSGDNFGYAVTAASDFNNDGISDILVGAYAGNNGNGAAYVVYGNVNPPSSINIAIMTNKQGITINGKNNGDNLGYAVATAGDFNNDGIADILIGAFGANYGAGATYIIYGGTNLLSPINVATMISTQGFIITGAGRYFSFQISAADDFNNDGIADILIGAFGANYDAGAAYIIYGGVNLPLLINVATMTIEQGITIISGLAGGYLGWSAVAASDFNNDGVADVLIGAPNVNNGVGAACVVYGVDIPTLTLTLTQSNSKTNTKTHTVTSSKSLSHTTTYSSTSTPTDSETSTDTITPTATSTNSRSPSYTTTRSATSTATPSNSETNTETSTPTSTPTNSRSPSYTTTYSATSTPTPSDSETNTETRTPTSTPTTSESSTRTATSSTTSTPTNSKTNTETQTPTVSESLTNTATRSATSTPTPSNSETSTETGTPTSTPTTSESSTRITTSSTTSTSTNSKTNTDTRTPTVSESLTNTATRSATSSSTPSNSETSIDRKTLTITPTTTRSDSDTKMPASSVIIPVSNPSIANCASHLKVYGNISNTLQTYCGSTPNYGILNIIGHGQSSITISNFNVTSDRIDVSSLSCITIPLEHSCSTSDGLMSCSMNFLDNSQSVRQQSIDITLQAKGKIDKANFIGSAINTTCYSPPLDSNASGSNIDSKLLIGLALSTLLTDPLVSIALFGAYCIYEVNAYINEISSLDNLGFLRNNIMEDHFEQKAERPKYEALNIDTNGNTMEVIEDL